MLRNFIEFLYIFGHFVRVFALSLHEVIHSCWQAGEDLEEDEEGEEYASTPEDEESAIVVDRRPYTGTSALGSNQVNTPPSITIHTPETALPTDANKATERSPLLRRTRSRSRSHHRRASAGHGDATVTQAVLMVSWKNSATLSH